MPSPGVTPLNTNLDQVGTPTSVKFESCMGGAILGRIAPVMSATSAYELPSLEGMLDISEYCDCLSLFSFLNLSCSCYYPFSNPSSFISI